MRRFIALCDRASEWCEAKAASILADTKRRQDARAAALTATETLLLMIEQRDTEIERAARLNRWATRCTEGDGSMTDDWLNKSRAPGSPCPKCSAALVRLPYMFHWRGEYFDGAVCTTCNSLWPIPGEEMPPLRPRQTHEHGSTRGRTNAPTTGGG
jgi:hypothetical protein